MNIATKLYPNIWRLHEQYFFSEPVGVYAVELPDMLLLFEIPEFSAETQRFIANFHKPVKALLSHGSTGVADGAQWQSKLGVEVYLHHEDKNYSWLKMQPDVLFSTMPRFGEGLTVIHTPGHSAGSVCLLHNSTKILFSGDTLCGNKNGEIADSSHDDDPLAWRQSCVELLQYDFNHILPFHYEMIQNTGKIALQNLVNTFE